MKNTMLDLENTIRNTALKMLITEGCAKYTSVNIGDERISFDRLSPEGTDTNEIIVSHSKDSDTASNVYPFLTTTDYYRSSDLLSVSDKLKKEGVSPIVFMLIMGVVCKIRGMA